MRTAMMPIPTTVNNVLGRSILNELLVEERLVTYFMSRCVIDNWRLRLSLLEATRAMVSDMPWTDCEALDKQIYPEHYI